MSVRTGILISAARRVLDAPDSVEARAALVEAVEIATRVKCLRCDWEGHSDCGNGGVWIKIGKHFVKDLNYHTCEQCWDFYAVPREDYELAKAHERGEV